MKEKTMVEYAEQFLNLAAVIAKEYNELFKKNEKLEARIKSLEKQIYQ